MITRRGRFSIAAGPGFVREERKFKTFRVSAESSELGLPLEGMRMRIFFPTGASVGCLFSFMYSRRCGQGRE